MSRTTLHGGQQLGRLLLVVFIPALLFARPASAQSREDRFLAALAELREATFVDKEAAIERLAETGHGTTRQVLVALLEDRLYVRQADGAVVIVKATDDGLAAFELVNPLSF